MKNHVEFISIQLRLYISDISSVENFLPAEEVSPGGAGGCVGTRGIM